MLNFFGDISDVPLFDLWIMPMVGTLTSRVIAARESAELERKVFEFYANICSKRMPLQVTLKVQRHSFFDATNHLEVRSRLIGILKAPEEFDTDIVACCLTAYPWFWRESENPGEIEAVYTILEKSVKNPGKSDAHLALLAANAIGMLSESLFRRITLDDLLKYYRIMENDETALCVLCMIMPFVESFNEFRTDITCLSQVMPCVCIALSEMSDRQM
ncbi:unnamed protein product [Gongylonema pulchrum]|uniref:Xpo1 domain-containing protein n=1 Tax=Gongylonema pulchrum TaxID=637853 RepID=A0A183ELY6_9BILA|nr:unnamed protein product [Gongylonema pulchrum]